MNKIDSRDRRPRLSENNGISFVTGERIDLKICGRIVWYLHNGIENCYA